MSATEIVQRQLDAYNAQDIDAFCACFAADCVLAELNGAVTQQGAAAIRQRYETLFSSYPENHATLVNRVVVGNEFLTERRLEAEVGVVAEPREERDSVDGPQHLGRVAFRGRQERREEPFHDEVEEFPLVIR